MFDIRWTLIGVALAAHTLLADDDWQPVPRRHSGVSVSYHGNAFHPHAQIEERYGKLNHLPSSAPYSRPRHHGLFGGGGGGGGVPAGPGGLVPSPDDDCGLYKVGFNQELYYEYMQYKEPVPDLKEFTLCAWTKFNNHSSDHPLFNYAVGDNPKAIASWVSNTERASYYCLAVAGHTFYRLNYPLRLNKWYHSCQSWNGRTGEWQIWVNAERVGRGFHNRLVGHVIKGGGVAVSGQEQSQLSAGPAAAFADGKKPRGTGGMRGELTMLQLYGVALTAGKAHKDHKHHHVHHFAHDGSPLPLGGADAANAATEPPPPMPIPIGGTTSQFVGGQIAAGLELNLAGAQPQPPQQPQLVEAQLPNGLRLGQRLANGQFAPGRAVSEQLFNGGAQFFPAPPQRQQQLQLQQQQPLQFQPQPLQQFQQQPLQLPQQHLLFKREGGAKAPSVEAEAGQQESKKQSKRGLVALPDGSIVDDSLLLGGGGDGESYEQSLLNGLAGLGENVPVQNIQKEKVDEREPAEAEVKAVMDLCAGCSEEPFQKALVMSWRHSSKKLFGGAYYSPAVPACKVF